MYFIHTDFHSLWRYICRSGQIICVKISLIFVHCKSLNQQGKKKKAIAGFYVNVKRMIKSIVWCCDRNNKHALSLCSIFHLNEMKQKHAVLLMLLLEN